MGIVIQNILFFPVQTQNFKNVLGFFENILKTICN